MLCTCSLPLVVTCNDLLKQGLIFKVKHDGSERVFPVVEVNTLGVGQCGVCLVSSKKLLHVGISIQCDSALLSPERLNAVLSTALCGAIT